jgi:hypothetical protein
MKRITFASMLAILTAPLSAWAQEVTPASAVPSITENFETLPLDRTWELLSPGVTVENGKLTCTSPAHAAWIKPQVRDLTLSFRYRHGSGVGDVMLRGSGEPPQSSEYHVQLNEPFKIMRLEDGRESLLASQAFDLANGQWHRVRIEATAGRIQVTVNGATVMSVTDVNPLPAGAIAFGCVVGSGFAFDDVVVQSPELGRPEFNPVPLPDPKAKPDFNPVPIPDPNAQPDFNPIPIPDPKAQADFNPVPIPFPVPWAEGIVDVLLVDPSSSVEDFLADNPWLVVQRGDGGEVRLWGHLTHARNLTTGVSISDSNAVALPTIDGRFVVVSARRQVAEAYQRRAAQCSDAERTPYTPLYVRIRFKGSATETVPVIIDPCEPTRTLPDGVVVAVGLKLMNSRMGISYCAGSGCLGMQPFKKGELVKKKP